MVLTLLFFPSSMRQGSLPPKNFMGRIRITGAAFGVTEGAVAYIAYELYYDLHRIFFWKMPWN